MIRACLSQGQCFRDQCRQPVCAENRGGKQPLGESIQSEPAWKLAEGGWSGGELLCPVVPVRPISWNDRTICSLQTEQ